jgi:hypothetical protein
MALQPRYEVPANRDQRHETMTTTQSRCGLDGRQGNKLRCTNKYYAAIDWLGLPGHDPELCQPAVLMVLGFYVGQAGNLNYSKEPTHSANKVRAVFQERFAYISSERIAPVTPRGYSRSGESAAEVE